MIGGNPRAAEFAGMRVTRRIVVVMLISGAIAGVSGMLHLAGPAQRLNSSISNNYGLSGFIVAALAGSSVVGVVAGSVFIAAALHCRDHVAVRRVVGLHRGGGVRAGAARHRRR